MVRTAALVGGAVIIITLMTFGFRDGSSGDPWGTTGIVCVSQEARDVAVTSNLTLSIFVDGIPEPLPASIGVREDCTAELSTRDESGGIYVITERPHSPRFKLREFFAVWDRPLEWPGYSLELSVSGIRNTSGGELIFKDGQDIELYYISPSYNTDTGAPFNPFEEDSSGGTDNLQFN